MSDLPFDLPNDLIDIQEQANEVDFLTPRDYARLKGVAPQMIYYHIRTGTLETFHCACDEKSLTSKKATTVYRRRRKHVAANWVVGTLNRSCSVN